jgi:hypothetical protein
VRYSLSHKEAQKTQKTCAEVSRVVLS